MLFTAPFTGGRLSPFSWSLLGFRAWLPGVDLDWWRHSNLLTSPQPWFPGCLLSPAWHLFHSLSLSQAWEALDRSVAGYCPHVLTCVDFLAYPFTGLLTPMWDSDSRLGNASSLMSDWGWILELHVTLHLPSSEILIQAFWHCLPTWDSDTNSRLERLPGSIYVCVCVCMYCRSVFMAYKNNPRFLTIHCLDRDMHVIVLGHM